MEEKSNGSEVMEQIIYGLFHVIDFLIFTIRYFAWFLLVPAFLYCRMPGFRVVGIISLIIALWAIAANLTQPISDEQRAAAQDQQEEYIGDASAE